MKNECRKSVKVGQKPEVCHQCGGNVVAIVYGEPTPETMEAANRGEVMLGGCCMIEGAPEWQCNKCGQHYSQA